MRVLLDTSVLVAALIRAHESHAIARPWLQKAKQRTIVGIVSAHSLAELFHILTIYPIKPRIGSLDALTAIESNIKGYFEIATLDDTDYLAAIEQAASAGVTGGAIYDALIMHAAFKANADQVITLNAKDFRRVYPALASRVVTP